MAAGAADEMVRSPGRTARLAGPDEGPIRRAITRTPADQHAVALGAAAKRRRRNGCLRTTTRRNLRTTTLRSARHRSSRTPCTFWTSLGRGRPDTSRHFAAACARLPPGGPRRTCRPAAPDTCAPQAGKGCVLQSWRGCRLAPQRPHAAALRKPARDSDAGRRGGGSPRSPHKRERHRPRARRQMRRATRWAHSKLASMAAAAPSLWRRT